MAPAGLKKLFPQVVRAAADAIRRCPAILSQRPVTNTQESGRRGSRGGGLPVKHSAPDLDALAKAAVLQQRVDEQDIELAALQVRSLFLQPMLMCAVSDLFSA